MVVLQPAVSRRRKLRPTVIHVQSGRAEILKHSFVGGASFAANVKVTTAQTDESLANPCADAGNQYGDYEGIVAFGGVFHPLWTDGRLNCTIDRSTGQRVDEEVFTARVS